MKIDEVRIEPDQPESGEILKVTIRLHNNSQEPATATVNAVLGSQNPSFPTAVQQYRTSLEADGTEDVTLFELMVDESFQPGQYKVEVWLTGPSSETKEAAFEIEDEDFKKTF